MFERYTEKARRIIFFARYEASQAGSTVIELPHLVAGLLRESLSTFQRVVKTELEALERIAHPADAPKRPKISTTVDLPFAPVCKQVLILAAEESELLGHSQIGAEHLLLGILRSDSRESRLLAPLGFTLDAARLAFLEPESDAAHDSRPDPRTPVTREEVQQLLAKLPDDRLPTAAIMLAALARRDLKFGR